MPRLTISTIALSLLLASPASAQKKAWEIDPAHSHLGFSVRHMLISNVRGAFGRYQVLATEDTRDLTRSSVQVTIEAASVDTRLAKRDEHLRSADFFDVARFPKITFESKKVRRTGKASFQLVGPLTIRGVTREVKLDVGDVTPPIKDPNGKTRIGLSASTRISRKDFGLTWNRTLEKGGLLVGDEVTIALELELVEREPQPTATK